MPRNFGTPPGRFCAAAASFVKKSGSPRGKFSARAGSAAPRFGGSAWQCLRGKSNAWGKPFWGGFQKGCRGVCKGIAASVKTDKRARRGALFAGRGFLARSSQAPFSAPYEAFGPAQTNRPSPRCFPLCGRDSRLARGVVYAPCPSGVAGITRSVRSGKGM